MRTLDQQIDQTRQKISALRAKESNYKERRVKQELKLKGLLKRREDQQDSLLLTAFKRQLETDPEQLTMLKATLDELPLSDEQRALVDLPPKNDGRTAARASESGRQTRGTVPPPAVNGTDAAPPQPKAAAPEANVPEGPGPEPPLAQDSDGTPAGFPDSAVESADEEPASPADRVDDGAAPLQPKAPNASAEPDDKPTENQLKYLKDLVNEYPDKAKGVGIDVESLSSLSKKKASWAITQLAPPRASAPRSRRRR